MEYTKLIELVVTVVTAVFASSGFWALIDRQKNRSNLSKKLLIGLAHDRIVFLSLKYIQRGCITQEEHENLSVFLYSPYVQMGGNGSAQRLMDEVNRLPITPVSGPDRILKEKQQNAK